MELLTNPQLTTHQMLMSSLLGPQKGGLQGIELFFTTQQYAKRTLKTQNTFYRDAIHAITKLQLKKKIEDVKQEKVFYNPTFRNDSMDVLHINSTCQNNNIYTYGDILTEYD